mmetsp:Transcript_128970/g.413070  ORF Transcript_128970/g.413070 Transcript_128970/m.413070 type:complete len:205 (-) Transcript_128970:2807-3421(-)
MLLDVLERLQAPEDLFLHATNAVLHLQQSLGELRTMCLCGLICLAHSVLQVELGILQGLGDLPTLLLQPVRQALDVLLQAVRALAGRGRLHTQSRRQVIQALAQHFLGSLGGRPQLVPHLLSGCGCGINLALQALESRLDLRLQLRPSAGSFRLRLLHLLLESLYGALDRGLCRCGSHGELRAERCQLLVQAHSEFSISSLRLS